MFIYMLHMFYTYIACILFRRLCMVAIVFKCFLVFFSVSEACFKCLNYLQTYVTTIIFGCFKSKSSVASLLPTFCCVISPSVGRASI